MEILEFIGEFYKSSYIALKRRNWEMINKKSEKIPEIEEEEIKKAIRELKYRKP